MTPRSNRRLVAIVAADVAGYSRLVGEDEEGTITALQSIRAEVIEPLVARHVGRIANTAGDSFLIEFPSVVDAVRASIDIQVRLEKRNAARPDDRAIALRIGINVGDVISSGDDILGDGVNIAARLEALAEPGGIVASQAAVDYARRRVSAGFTSMGAHRVKNIAEPVQAFRVEVGKREQAGISSGKRRLPRLVAASLAVIAIIVAGVFWWKPWEGRKLRASETRMAFPLPDLPSIAVLPFADQSGESANVMLADGITEDLITDLSRISDVFVIAGNSSFAYRDKEIDIARFAEELGVRYVVDGSLRRAGSGLRINIRLTDTANGRLIWAERFDGEMGDLFAAQNRFVLAIAEELDLTLDAQERGEIEKAETTTIEAREAFQSGWELYARFNESDNRAAIPHFKRAVELDPEYGRAWAALALAHLRPHIFHHWNAFADDSGQLHIGLFYEYLREASRYETSLVHVVRAIVSLNFRERVFGADKSRGTDEARRESATAIALQPSDPEAHLTMGWALIAAGEPQEGLSFVQAAMRLDPKHPSHYFLFEAAAYFAMGDLATATEALLSGLEHDPKAVELMPVATSFLALSGEQRAARDMLDRWQAGENDAGLNATVEEYFFVVRWVGEHQHLNARLSDGLRLAALPPGTNVGSLRADLSRGDASDQRRAARALALFGPDAAPAVPELTALLGSSSAFVTKEAAIALGRIGAAAAPALPALEARADASLVGKIAARSIELIEADLED